MDKRDKIIETILWSIALPGFPQVLNGQLFKGFLFILLEILINIMANFKLGTVWFPMLCVIPGLIIGFTLKRILRLHQG